MELFYFKINSACTYRGVYSRYSLWFLYLAVAGSGVHICTYILIFVLVPTLGSSSVQMWPYLPLNITILVTHVYRYFISRCRVREYSMLNIEILRCIYNWICSKISMIYDVYGGVISILQPHLYLWDILLWDILLWYILLRLYTSTSSLHKPLKNSFRNTLSKKDVNKKAIFSQNIHYINILSLKTLLSTFYIFLLCIIAFSCISYNSTINTLKFKCLIDVYPIDVNLIEVYP